MRRILNMQKQNLYNEMLNANYSNGDSHNIDGYYIGCPTVKEFIEILSKLPEDFRVTCCGAENYVYLFPKDGYITIDSESCLCI